MGLVILALIFKILIFGMGRVLFPGLGLVVTEGVFLILFIVLELLLLTAARYCKVQSAKTR